MNLNLIFPTSTLMTPDATLPFPRASPPPLLPFPRLLPPAPSPRSLSFTSQHKVFSRVVGSVGAAEEKAMGKRQPHSHSSANARGKGEKAPLHSSQE